MEKKKKNPILLKFVFFKYIYIFKNKRQFSYKNIYKTKSQNFQNLTPNFDANERI